MGQKKKNGFFADFKKFLSRGNILDLAVAVIIGAAFGKIVTSLVNDIIMPLVSLALGGISVYDWKWVITPATYDSAGVILKAESALNYGAFIMAILDFLIIAFCIFMIIRIVVRAQNELKKLTKKGDCEEAPAEEKAPPAPTEKELLAEIRDLLKLQAQAHEEKQLPPA